MEIVEAITLRHYLDRVYIRAKLDLKPNSAHQLSVAVSLLDRWHGRAVLLSELAEDLLSDWLRSLKNAGRSCRTINGRRASIITIWRHASKAGLAKKFDTADVPRCKSLKRQPTAWSVEEMRSLVPLIRREWLRTFAMLLYDTGCRLAAASLLTWANWNASTRTITLPAETSKTGLEQRIKISQATADAIESLRPIIMRNSDRIFPCPNDKRTMWAELKSALKAAGLPHTRRDLFQKIRRTNATHVAANSSIEVAQRQLGHSSLRMTVDNYIDPTFLPHVQAVDVLPPL